MQLLLIIKLLSPGIGGLGGFSLSCLGSFDFFLSKLLRLFDFPIF
jgi:hypothetical protein